jgi:hypothetical protein
MQISKLFVDSLGNAPTGCWRPFGQHLTGIGDPLEIGQIVMKTHKALRLIKEFFFLTDPNKGHMMISSQKGGIIPL